MITRCNIIGRFMLYSMLLGDFGHFNLMRLLVRHLKFRIKTGERRIVGLDGRDFLRRSNGFFSEN